MRCKLYIIILLIFSMLIGCKISGKITYEDEDLEGIIVTLKGKKVLRTLTNSNGVYTFFGIKQGFYTITPSKSGYKFYPELKIVKKNKRDIYGVNFKAEQDIIRVPEDYETIQDAIDAACEGNTILVSDGIYTENVNVYKRLTIQSENGYESTTVSSDQSDDLFYITSDNVSISGFTMINATHLGAAIKLDNVSQCKIFNNRCGSDDQWNGIGILLRDSDNNEISENIICSTKYGPGIEIYNSNTITITNNVVYSNDKVGMMLNKSDNTIISGNIFDSNLYEGISLYEVSNRDDT